jgi:hypothetical protein
MKIDFCFDTQYGRFCDALHFPDDHTHTDAEIEAMKQQRLDNWIAVVSYVPTEEEIAQMEAEALAAQEPPVE